MDRSNREAENKRAENSTFPIEDFRQDHFAQHAGLISPGQREKGHVLFIKIAKCLPHREQRFIQIYLIGESGRMIARRHDRSVGIEEPKKGSACRIRFGLVRPWFDQDSLQFGKSVAIQIIEILFFERGAHSDRMGKGTAFFGNDTGLSFLHGEKGAHLVLKLRVECFLLSGSQIFLCEIKRGAGHSDHHQHQCEQ